MTEKNESKGRRFRALQVLALPQGLHSAPGATNMRMNPGDIVTLDDDAARQHERYLNGRLRAGDFEEVEEHVVTETKTGAAAASRADEKEKR